MKFRGCFFTVHVMWVYQKKTDICLMPIPIYYIFLYLFNFFFKPTGHTNGFQYFVVLLELYLFTNKMVKNLTVKLHLFHLHSYTHHVLI